MMIIPVTDLTWDLCTALLGDAPVVHGTETFVVVSEGDAPTQIFAWELEEHLPADNARHMDIRVFTERD